MENLINILLRYKNLFFHIKKKNLSTLRRKQSQYFPKE